MNLPVAFEKRMKEMLDHEYDDYIASYEEERYYGLRINTNKISVADFLAISPFKLQAIPWIENGFYYDGTQIKPSRHPYYFAGLYYLQEPSAMTPASRLPIKTSDKVLDICAAPGGKTTELGAKLQGTGLLVANDISNSRAKALLKNVELFGIGNVLILSEEPGKLQDHFTNYFDKILIDAPCSGEGMFRKDKKMIKSWEERGPEFYAPIQKEIIIQAAKMLKPGGMMMYSTCTFDPAENEETIAYLLKECKEFQIREIKHYEGFKEGRPVDGSECPDELKKTVRIWPHKMHGEGHYLALLEKGGAVENQRTAVRVLKTNDRIKSDSLPDELGVFFHNITWEIDASDIVIIEEKVYYMPEGLPRLKGLRFLRTGLYLGDIKKKRFEPSQALAMYLKKEEYSNTLDFKVTDDRVIRYLKGETLEVSDITTVKDNGWYLICVDSYPLGFGKVVNQSLKNKYSSGWRWQS